MAEKKSLDLRRYVFREFFKAALMPLLFIELALIVLYFSINAINHDNSLQTLEQESMAHLEEIVVDQSRILNEQIRAITSLGRILQAQTVRFYDTPDLVPPASDAPGQYALAPNGTYYQTNDNGKGSLYYSNVTPIGPLERAKASRSEVLGSMYKHIVEANPNVVAVYLNTYDSMNRYYPFIPEIYNQYLPNMDITGFNFYYLADTRHNPRRGPVWTQTYLDPAGKGWMMSCIVPIYSGDFLQGVAGIDITIKKFLDNILDLELPWGAEAFLVDGSGMIMAMPSGVERAFGLTELREHVYKERVSKDTYKPEEFRLTKTSVPGAAQVFTKMLNEEKSATELTMGANRYLVSQATVRETGWKLMVLADKHRILEPIIVMGRNARRIGYAAVGGMVGFYLLFFLYLLYNAGRISRQIAYPVVEISERSMKIAAGNYDLTPYHGAIRELDVLNDSYSVMVREIQQLHADLRAEIERANNEIDERKLTQQELRRARDAAEGANRAKNEFLANMNHELRTPLTHIMGFTEILLEQRFGPLNERQQRYLTNVLTGSTRLLALINDILDLAKVEAGQQELMITSVDLRRLLENSLVLIREKAGKRGITISTAIHTIPQTITADERKLKQVLYNLLANAVKFTGEGGRICVSAALVDGTHPIIGDQKRPVEPKPHMPTVNFNARKPYVLISVMDTGVGIKAGDLNRIFNTFEQADGSSRRRFQGSGLGLSLSKTFVEMHGGCIWAESEGEGLGATFRFILPCETPLQGAITA